MTVNGSSSSSSSSSSVLVSSRQQTTVSRLYMLVYIVAVDVSIVEPADSTLPVRHGSSFSLKCVARVRRPLDPGVMTGDPGVTPRYAGVRVSTGLRWLHDGQPLSDGTDDGLCGRVVITDVIDVHTGHTHTHAHTLDLRGLDDL